MRVALDAMGGDKAPAEIVKGALQAVNLYPEIKKIFLVGKEEEIKKYLNGNAEKIEIIDAREVIEMDDHPALAYRKKKDASMTVATRLVKEGRADAIISAGNTGGQMTSSLFVLGRIKGISRPAIATPLPAMKGITLLLDSGANADCTVENLQQFALMGSIYAKKVLKKDNPKVSLVNIGSERTKGNELSIKAYEELEKMDNINFTGNIEGREIPQGKADVIVADGFVGNVVLKLIEGMGKTFVSIIKEEVSKSFISKLGAFLMKDALMGLKKKMDYAEIGGAPLLGVDGISIICHGSSDSKAIHNAIRVAIECKKEDYVQEIKNNL
ncbi:MAG: phosphate acyltransferase PlsX [Eubacteriales bacterium]|nr:phosphate acyltransferase PlsX [Eubacteriales bacterium]